MMLGISRWAGKSGSYRTVQRLYNTLLPWAEIFWAIFHNCLFQPRDEYILAGDEVVVSQAGEATFGKDCIFSNLAQRAIPGLSFFTFSLVNVRLRRSSPICMEQIVRSAEEKAACKAKAQARKAKEPTEKRIRGFRYVVETIKMLPQKPDRDLLTAIFLQVACLGSIHPTQPAVSTT